MLYWVAAAKTFASDEAGASSVEYALVFTLVSLLIIGAVGLMGQQLSNTFTVIADKFRSY